MYSNSEHMRIQGKENLNVEKRNKYSTTASPRVSNLPADHTRFARFEPLFTDSIPGAVQVVFQATLVCQRTVYKTDGCCMMKITKQFCSINN